MEVPSEFAESVAVALMDCAADHDEGGDVAVSVDVGAGIVEMEVITTGNDPSDALSNGMITIQQVCSCADFQVVFEGGQLPCPDRWSVEPQASANRMF